MNWLLLVMSLPTQNATARMRAWRALKGAGAAVLRDGVYLLPPHEACRATFEAVARELVDSGGSAHLLHTDEPEGGAYAALFDRSEDYAALLADILPTRRALRETTAEDTLKTARRLRKTLEDIVATDFFPGEARRQAEAALEELEQRTRRLLEPDEPHPVAREIGSLPLADFRNRTWATRARPWVDRLACAWLIRRQIDRKARIVWLAPRAAVPRDAVGFDFDGATFSHVGARVSFEVMLASFGLEQPALLRLGALVHHLDVGGVQPVEAAGLEAVLGGLRDTIADDDKLLAAASTVFDALLARFEKAATSA